MQRSIVDVFHIKKKGNNVFECNNFAKLNSIINNNKKISDMIQKIYIYDNLHFIINLNNNNKKCELIENYENKIINNLLVNKLFIKEVGLDAFPFIEKYFDIIERHTSLYQNGISIVKETSENSKETTTFIRIESSTQNFSDVEFQNKVEKIINFIE